MASCGAFSLHLHECCHGHGYRREDEANTYALQVGDACDTACELSGKGDEYAVVDGDEDDQEAKGDDG